MARQPKQEVPPERRSADLDLLSRPGHGRTRWLECPACGSHELRRPTPDESRREPPPELVCFACGVAFRAGVDGTLVPVR